MPRDKRIIVYPLLIALLTAGVYLNSLNSPFHFDDYHSILKNPYIRNLSNIPKFLINPEMFSVDKTAKMYRPLLLITYALNYKIGGYNPLGYHIVNILLHTLNTLLIYFILLFLLSAYYTVPNSSSQCHCEPPKVAKQSQNEMPLCLTALLASLLFGVHTLNTQAVNYISSRSVILATLFYLLSFYLYIRSTFQFQISNLKFKIYFIVSLLSYALSLLSKEIAITLPLILLLYDYLFLTPSLTLPPRGGGVGGGVSYRLKYYLPYWAITAGYLLIRKSLMGKATINLSVKAFTEGTPDTRGIYINLLTQAKANLFYIKSLFLPTGLSVEHYMEVAKGIGEASVLFSIFIILLLIVFAIFLRKRYWGMSFGILWFFIATMPETIIPLNMIINEHRTYLPMVGFAIFCGFGLHRIKDGRGTLQRAPTTWPSWVIVTVFLLLFLFFNALGTINRNEIWQDEYTLWKDAVEKYPGHLYRAHNMLGLVYSKQGLRTKALKEYETSIRIEPKNSQAYYNIGRLYSESGILDKAIKEYKIAIELRPSFAEAHNNLGAVYHDLGRLDEAIEEYKIALSLRPDYEMALRNLNRANAEMSAGNRSGK